MKRETELLIKGANVEVIKILRDFDEIMNAELVGETIIVDKKGNELPGSRRKVTLQDKLELIENEWCNTLEQLNEIGIDVEDIEDPKEMSNHEKVHDELVEYLLTAAQNDKTSYLEFNNIQIPYADVSIKKDNSGSLITLYRDEYKNEMVASILLKKDVEYIVEDQTGTGCHPLLIEK